MTTLGYYRGGVLLIRRWDCSWSDFASSARKAVIPLLAATAILLGCRRASDQDWDEQQTRSRLRDWGEVIVLVHSNRIDDAGKYKTIRDVIASWTKSGIIREREVPRMETDYWGRPFIWEVR